MAQVRAVYPPIQLRIIDIYGKTILEQILNQQSTKINLGNVPNGIYLMQLFDGAKIMYIKKIAVEN
ncbi:MAG: T9SS type A sorting domain-containing protein [Ignavibacterium sp.]|nr:T9SS type A sorting domain-containing protein [Ignavibacterium sp.]